MKSNNEKKRKYRKKSREKKYRRNFEKKITFDRGNVSNKTILLNILSSSSKPFPTILSHIFLSHRRNICILLHLWKAFRWQNNEFFCHSFIIFFTHFYRAHFSVSAFLSASIVTKFSHTSFF